MSFVRGRFAKQKIHRLSSLPIEEAFDQIYEQGFWSNGSGQLSGGGSYGRAADEYVAFVQQFIKQHEVRSILDIGCGDFNIGARIAPLVGRYHAVDVSARIIAINRARFASLANVDFRQLNACVEALQRTDLITVRQVFQHLTNAQIESILKNMERTAPQFALVTEHLSAQTREFRPNLDLSGHSAMTRVAMGSGVVLDAAPFSRDVSTAAIIDLPAGDTGRPTEERRAAEHETLRISLLRLQRA